MSALTQQEQNLVHAIEVMGLSVTKAAEHAGLDKFAAYAALDKPHVADARTELRAAMQRKVGYSKDEIIEGISEAISIARVIADPNTMIRGWESIARLTGHDKPTQVNINIVGSRVSEVRKELARMNDEQLLQIAGVSDVIDADFYEVKQ